MTEDEKLQRVLAEKRHNELVQLLTEILIVLKEVRDIKKPLEKEPVSDAPF